jgi:hypothetical protein
MDKNVFWDVFRETGDPMCWLLSRMESASPAEKQGEKQNRLSNEEEANASSS